MPNSQAFYSRLLAGQFLVVSLGGFAGDEHKSLCCSVFLEGGEAGMSGGNPARSRFDFAECQARFQRSLNVFAAGLVINKPGQSWGGTTAGVQVSDRSVLYAPSSNLVITGSHAQGIVVLNNSHATVTGASITGSGHGGLVVSNLSSIDVTGGNPTLVAGSAVDLFCDSNSTITGSANLAGVPTSQCANVLAAEATLP